MTESRSVFQTEIRVRDMGRAVTFYKTVFDWKIYKAAEDSALIDTGALPVVSFLQTTDPRFPLGVVNNLIVEDCEQEGVRAVALGGRITVVKSEIPGKGAFVNFVDPWGAEFCFWEPYVTARPALQGSGKNPISFIEVVTPDMPAAFNFYSQLMGWSFWNVVFKDEFSMAEGCGLKRGVGLYGSAGSAGLATTYVEVENLEETAAKVLAAGGTIRVPASVFPGEGRYIVFEDIDGLRMGAVETPTS